MSKDENFISNQMILRITVVVLFIVLLVLVVVGFLLSNHENTPDPGNIVPTQTSQSTESSFLDEWTSSVPQTDGQTVPNETGPQSSVSPEPDPAIPTGSTAPEPTVPENTQVPTVSYTPTEPEIPEISCDKFAVFSGVFVEDGKGAPVENVAAILVTNQTDHFLDIATMTYDVDGREATFVITGLHPGKSAWVMEGNGMTIPADAVFTYLDCVTAFRDDVITRSEDVTIQYDGNLLLAVNNTNRILENVIVYYKTLHSDGNYFGGITYLVSFGTLEPGTSVEKIAGHYDGENSEIVRISWQESQTGETS